MLRIAIDMDEVMADTVGKVLEWLADTYGYALTREALRGVPLESLIKPEHAQAMERMLHEGHLFGQLELMPNCLRVVKGLHARYEVFVASAAMDYPLSCAPKFTWLQRHFPFIEPKHIVFCGDKAVINAHYLIDDNARHFARFCGQGLLFDAPHNAKEQRYTRVPDWEAIATRFLGSETVEPPERA